MTEAERNLLLAIANHIQDWLELHNDRGASDAEIREIRELSNLVIDQNGIEPAPEAANL